MTTQFLAKWADRYGITLTDAKALRRLSDKRAREQEHALNGDPHPSVLVRSDKNANAKAWESQSDRTDAEFLALAKDVGFDNVDFGVGLYPALMKGAETCIMIPG
jgi:hypothetical protein